MVNVIVTDNVSKWLKNLRDRKAMAIITARIERIEGGNIGDAKIIGEGIGEVRIHYGAGYRLYFLRKGNALIIMLAGGDKSSQPKDIKLAKKLAEKWR